MSLRSLSFGADLPGDSSPVDAVVPLLASIAVLLVLDPGLWFRPTVPVVTDLPGHLLAPGVLADRLLPQGRIQGWSHDWFAGFPVYRFYFPLPGVLTAVVSWVTGGPLALRIVAAAPLVLLPWSLWAFGRLGGLGRAVTAGLVLVGSSYVLMTSHRVMGGNIRSVVGGEFSYAWSILFLVLHLGILAGPGRSRWRAVASGAALALAVLSHVVPVMVAALGTAPLLLIRSHRARLLGAWVATGVFTAFWFLPMVLSLDFIASPGWAFVPGWEQILPSEMLFLIPAALVGLRVARDRPALLLLTSVGLTAVAVAAIPQGLVMRARPLPLWYLTVHVLAGAGFVRALSWPREGRWQAPLMRLLGVILVAGWLSVVAVRGGGASYWQEVMRGLPAQPGYPALQGILADLEELPPGRIHWEPAREVEAIGGEHTLSLIPTWTRHTALPGLLGESAPLFEMLPTLNSELMADPVASSVTGGLPRSVPRLDPDPGRAVERLRMLGVRYLLTLSDGTSRAVEAHLGPPVSRRDFLRLFDLGEAPLVLPLPCWSELEEGAEIRPATMEWFLGWEPGDPPVVRWGETSPTDPAGACDPGDGGAAVELLEFSPERIRFRTRQPERPHLVRVSYFPEWRVEGGSGPYPASPWFMVVRPEGEEVTLRFVPGPTRRAGTAVSLVGWAALILAAGGSLVRRRRELRTG